MDQEIMEWYWPTNAYAIPSLYAVIINGALMYVQVVRA